MQFVVQGGASPPNSFHSDRNATTVSSPSLSSNTIQSSGGLNSQAVYTGRSLGGFSDQAYSGRSLANNVDGSEFVYSGQGFPSDRFHVLSGNGMSGVSLDGNVNSTQVVSSQAQQTSPHATSPTSTRPNQGGGPRVIIARGSDRQVVDIKPKNAMNVSATPYVFGASQQQQSGLSSSTPSYYAEMMPTAVNLPRNLSPPPQQQQPLPLPQHQSANQSPQPHHQGQLPFGVHYDPNVMVNMQYNQAMYQMQAYQHHQHQQQGAAMPYPFGQQQFVPHHAGMQHHHQQQHSLPPPPMYNTVNQPPIQFGGNTAALSDAFGRLSAANNASTGNQDSSSTPAPTGYKTRSRRGGVKARQRAACRRAWEEEQMAKAAAAAAGGVDSEAATPDEYRQRRDDGSGGVSREREGAMDGSQLGASNRSVLEGSRNSERSLNNTTSDRAGSTRHESKE